MPYRPIKDSDPEVYEYVDSDEENHVEVGTSDYYEEDMTDEWDADTAALCYQRNLFTFKLGSRIISAWGTPCSSVHPNVHRLEIPHGWFTRFLLQLVTIIPQSVRDWLLGRYPEWFLPSTVILKRQKPQWGEEFERERDTYAQLRDVQGLVIPICYGEVQCCLGNDSDWYDCSRKKRRSLILSELDGCDLNSDSDACPRLEASELSRMLREALALTLVYGVLPTGDGKLGNIRLVSGGGGGGGGGGRRIMFMDLELCSRKIAEEDREGLIEGESKFLVSRYLEHQEAVAYEKAAEISVGLFPPQGAPRRRVVPQQ